MKFKKNGKFDEKGKFPSFGKEKKRLHEERWEGVSILSRKSVPIILEAWARCMPLLLMIQTLLVQIQMKVVMERVFLCIHDHCSCGIFG